MKGDRIRYVEGYKYQLKEDYVVETNLRPATFIRTPFVRLDVDGFLYIFEGYAWDGASGPAIDSHDNMRASLVHDALSQLARAGFLDAVQCKDSIDYEYFKILEEDGMWAFRRGVHRIGLSIAGISYLKKQDEKILEAP